MEFLAYIMVLSEHILFLSHNLEISSDMHILRSCHLQSTHLVEKITKSYISMTCVDVLFKTHTKQIKCFFFVSDNFFHISLSTYMVAASWVVCTLKMGMTRVRSK